MGFFSSLKSGVQRAALVSQCALSGISLAKAESGDAEEQFKYGKALRNGTLSLKQNRAAAIEWLEKAANQNCIPAMRELGDMLIDGGGAEANPARGLEWYEKAAHAGDKDAQREVGNCYSNGVGTAIDKGKAASYYEMAAKNGCVSSMKTLAEWSRDGIGVEKSLAKMIAWYTMAADAKDGDSMMILGDCHATGLGVDRDEAVATDWYRKGAEAGHADSMVKFGKRLLDGAGIEADADAAFVWYARALEKGSSKVEPLVDQVVAEWSDKRPEEFCSVSKPLSDLFKAFAQKGNAIAQYCAGCCRLKGLDGADPDESEAAKYFEKAASEGHALAQLCMGDYMERRKAGLLSGGPDLMQAAGWYEKAAANGVPDAKFRAGVAYYKLKDSLNRNEKGEEFDKVLAKAVKWLGEALDSGTTLAAFYLGDCYENGYGVEKDLCRAFEMYGRICNADSVAAPKGYEGELEHVLPESQYRLGRCFAEGLGTDMSPDNAMLWFNKAAEGNHAEAEYRIGQAYRDGFCYSEDPAKAVEWFTRSASHGSSESMSQLGWCHEMGYGVEENECNALHWYLSALAAGREDVRDKAASLTDAVIGQNERDFSKDVFAVLERAAELGICNAEYYVGLMYCPLSDQRLVDHDRDKGFRFLKSAAGKDHCEAAFYVAECYFRGEASNMLGFASSSEGKAKEWYSKAALSSNPDIAAMAGERIEEIKAAQAERAERRAEMRAAIWEGMKEGAKEAIEENKGKGLGFGAAIRQGAGAWDSQMSRKPNCK